MLNGMRKALFVALIVATPLLFMANVWQSYRFHGVESQLRVLQDKYLEVLEDNKRMIVGIAGLRSPSRVRSLAEEELGLEAVPADRVDRVFIESNRGIGE